MSDPAASREAGSHFWQRRVIAPIMAQLKQGITPEKIALTIALGVVCGVFPILGATTLLCALVAWRLKLNQPVIQLVNYGTYPLHLILLLPFYRAGETLFRQEHLPIFSITDLLGRFKAGPLQFFMDYGKVGVYGIVVWCLVAPFAIALIYYAARNPIRVLSRRVTRQQAV